MERLRQLQRDKLEGNGHIELDSLQGGDEESGGHSIDLKLVSKINRFIEKNEKADKLGYSQIVNSFFIVDDQSS